MIIILIAYLVGIIAVGMTCYHLGYLQGWDKGIQKHFFVKGILGVIQEIRDEIDSRPQYPNVGKKGCIKCLSKLLESVKPGGSNQ